MKKEELDRILNEVCRQQTPVTLISVDSGGICKGRFKTLSGRLISLDLPQPPERFTLEPLSQCVCLFRQRNGGCAFLASVESFEKRCSPAILFLHRPEDAALESRRAFRVPVTSHSPKVELKSENGESFSVDPVDISVAGALVEFSGVDVPDFPIGSRFEVKLQLDELSVTVGAEVHRKYGKHYGLFFPEVPAEQSTELSKLVHRVEQTWLNSAASETAE